MKTIIITAFEAFGDSTENPTQDVLAEIPDFMFDTRVIKVSLPVVYGHAFDVLLPYIEEHNPKLILMLGLAAGRTHVNIERIAININDTKSKDNLGHIRQFHTIKDNGQDGLFTTLPLQQIMSRMHKKALPVAISNTAGAYVCNDLMYRVLSHIKTLQLDTKAGFIHVPYLPHQVINKPSMPSMDRRIMVEAVTSIIDVLMNPIELDPRQ